MKHLLTVLNFSAGKQSSALLWMILRGDIETPENFVVLNADPGMENSYSYKYVSMMRIASEESGVYFETCKGPNLYEDLIDLRKSNCTRMDTPPYWTLSKDGKVGRLMQECTHKYKIAPMDKAIRRLLKERHGIALTGRPKMPEGCVEKWIGYAADETGRMSNPTKLIVPSGILLLKWVSEKKVSTSILTTPDCPSRPDLFVMLVLLTV